MLCAGRTQSRPLIDLFRALTLFRRPASSPDISPSIIRLRTRLQRSAGRGLTKFVGHEREMDFEMDESVCLMDPVFFDPLEGRCYGLLPLDEC